jgi:hypothetical protein
MKRIFFLILILINLNCCKSQIISITTDKEIYTRKDSIEIKVNNTDSIDLFYVIALELNLNNKWGELESDINTMGMKGENMKPLKKNQVLIRKIILPDYIIRIVSKDGNKIRLRLKYGRSYDKTNQIYSNTFRVL